jgi:short-subunit dehydrogenase
MPLNTPIRDWRGKRVWILGATTGIGAALAEALAERGANLALSARNVDRLEQAAKKLPGSIALPLDLTQPNALLPSVLQLLDLWGGLDMVVLCVGAYTPLRAADLTIEGARQTIETHLIGVINGTAAVLPQLLHQKEGALVIVGGAAGYRGLPKALVYGAVKAAVINFAEGLYLDLKSHGVSVFLVNPGWIEAPGWIGRNASVPVSLSASEAAECILSGIGRGRFEIHFPKRLTYFLRLLRMLPGQLYVRMMKRAAN